MQNQPTVKYISQFLVCESQTCFQAVNICHKSYFKQNHYDIVNNKKITHKSRPFDQSHQFTNFYNLTKIQSVITKKITQSLKGFNTNIDSIVQGAIYHSQIFLQIFGNNQAVIGQYLYLRNIQKGYELGIVYAFTDIFCTSLLTNSQKKVSKCYKQICRDTPQWQNLNAQFNLASGINSNHLQVFIQKQIQYFVSYCQKLNQQKKQFSIGNYISLRNTSKQYENDPYYFNNEFTSFLKVKYQQNPQKKQIFSVMQYYLHFWQYFYIIVDTSKNVAKYFEQQVSFYQEYEAIVQALGLKQSFLSFRMWRLNNKVSNYKPSLRNPFFLQNYIYSYIEDLIYKKLYYPQQKRTFNFKQFAKYLKDYIKFVRDTSQSFSFGRYREYIDFRKKNQPFEELLMKNKEVIYSKKYYLQYIHGQFVDGNRGALKKYKKYQETKKIQEDQKSNQFKKQTESLKKIIQEQQKQHFYEIIYVNYINSISQSQELPTKSSYQIFKSNILQNFDQGYIQEEESNYKLALAEQINQLTLKNQEKGEDTEKGEKKESIVKEEINEFEQKIAQIIGQQEKSQASSSQQEEDIICPCCYGLPYECKQKQCIMMGCCTTCMFD